MQYRPDWTTPAALITRECPDEPVFCFAPRILQDTARHFQAGFPGQVTYAVKANPAEAVLANLVAAGLSAFDVASPVEMAAVRAVSATANLHYHNPVRSPSEIEAGLKAGITSWSVDRPTELEKLSVLPKGSEIAVRLCLPISGAAYDFGSKFGAPPDLAVQLLQRVQRMGHRPSMTFHPGTQCTDPAAWSSYIAACREVADRAGVVLHRLNVGGGFAAQPHAAQADHSATFEHIAAGTRAQFGPHAPALVCEPGRAMVAGSFALLTRIKAKTPEGELFLNDGIYGGLAETRDLDLSRRLQLFDPQGRQKTGPVEEYTLFGPTCDSIDRLPGTPSLPNTAAAGDYILFHTLGAYGASLATRFNGYGPTRTVTVASLT